MKMPAGGVPKNVTDPAQAANAMSSTINGFDKDLGNIKMAIRYSTTANGYRERHQVHVENGH